MGPMAAPTAAGGAQAGVLEERWCHGAVFGAANRRSPPQTGARRALAAFSMSVDIVRVKADPRQLSTSGEQCPSMTGALCVCQITASGLN